MAAGAAAQLAAWEATMVVWTRCGMKLLSSLLGTAVFFFAADVFCSFGAVRRAWNGCT